MTAERVSGWVSYLTGTDASDPLIPGLSSLSVSSPTSQSTPAPIGCGLHSNRATLISFYVASVAHLEVIVAHTKRIGSIAKKNHNKIVYAVLGVADDDDVVSAVLNVLPKANRVFLAGAAETRHADADAGPWSEYLNEAVLVEYVSDGAGSGTWLLPSSGDACLALVDREKRSAMEWKEAINAAYATDHDVSGLLSVPSSDLPFARLDAVNGMTVASDASVSTMSRTIEWVVSDPRDVFCWPGTKSMWSAHTTGPMVSWSATSSCAKTIAALSAEAPALDRQLTHADLQEDVSLTLATLIKSGLQGFATMRGVVGPMVLAGRDKEELLRCIEWTDAESPGNESVVMLLPESYMRVVFPDYNGPDFKWNQWLGGFLCLSNASAIPLHVEGCQAEADDVNAMLGTRLWKTARSVLRSEAAIQAVKLADVVAETMGYMTQQEAARNPERVGAQISSSTHTIFYTNTSAKDHLTGLRVRWVFAADRPSMPTLDADNRDGGGQLEYETVA